MIRRPPVPSLRCLLVGKRERGLPLSGSRWVSASLLLSISLLGSCSQAASVSDVSLSSGQTSLSRKKWAEWKRPRGARVRLQT